MELTNEEITDVLFRNGFIYHTILLSRGGNDDESCEVFWTGGGIPTRGVEVLLNGQVKPELDNGWVVSRMQYNNRVYLVPKHTTLEALEQWIVLAILGVE